MGEYICFDAWLVHILEKHTAALGSPAGQVHRYAGSERKERDGKIIITEWVLSFRLIGRLKQGFLLTAELIVYLAALVSHRDCTSPDCDRQIEIGCRASGCSPDLREWPTGGTLQSCSS